MLSCKRWIASGPASGAAGCTGAVSSGTDSFGTGTSAGTRSAGAGTRNTYCVYQSASVCPGEVRCGTYRPGFGRPVYNSTSTVTTTTSIVDPKVSPKLTHPIGIEADLLVGILRLTRDQLIMNVTTTVAAREGVCPIITDDLPEVQIITVTYTNTSTQWFVSYTTVTNSTDVTIGVTSAVNCIWYSYHWP